MLFDNSSKRIETFKCQNCREYTTFNNGQCKYCQTPIDLKAAQEYDRQQEADMKMGLSIKNRNLMIQGLLFFIGGTVLTVGTFIFGAELGHRVVIFWAAILYGGANFVEGLLGWLQNKV